jgi:2-keto-4-pentenoate hydratase
MTPPSRLLQLAKRLTQAWHGNTPVPLPEQDWEGFSLADGYAVQKLVAAELGWFPDGHPLAWKLGGSPANGISAAPVVANTLLNNGSLIDPGMAAGYGIEGELAIRLGADIPPGSPLPVILRAISGIAPCIELCDMRLMEGDRLPAGFARADQHWNRALILGDFLPLPTDTDWDMLGVSVTVNGNPEFQAHGSHPFLNPLNSLTWLATHAAQEWDGLHAGDIVATGSWNGLYWAHQSDTLEVNFEHFGKVSLTIGTPT